MSGSKRHALASIELDEVSIGRTTPEKEHERAVAIYDLIEANHFALPGQEGGPYSLILSMIDNKLSFDIRNEAGDRLMTHVLSLTPFRRVMRDYFMICESYYEAIRTASPTQIEAIDMGRRGLHNDAAELLTERLQGKVELDFNTSRRLFTLIAALHWKG